MANLARWLKHLWLDEHDAARALGVGALERIGARVAASESRHSGEIRVCVESGLPFSYLRRGAAARERALAMFGKLRVWDTEANNGVLIYLLLADRAIEIVADRGLERRVDASEWAAIAASMSASFREAAFEAGLCQAIDGVDRLLVRHFPLAEGRSDTNELPDAPVLQ